MKGVVNGGKLGETVQTWINDDASVLLIKVNDENIWMWTKSHEQYVHKPQPPNAGEDRGMQRKNSSLYRSNSYDRRGSGQNTEDASQVAIRDREPN